MPKPQIVIENYAGFHNTSPLSSDRLIKGKTYRDLSTICIIPCFTKKGIPPKVVQSWWSLMTPMNQKFVRALALDMEVGEAYSSIIENLLNMPDLSQWKYLLTLETDNMPPPDGLLRLYENMDKYDIMGGLYWTKGEEGQPMIYGDPEVMPRNFIPQVPKTDTIQPCNGLGMGFTLFKLDIFRDKRLPRPLFKTFQSHDPQIGSRAYTQDLYFFENAIKIGYRVACDTRVKVGHYDPERDMVW